MKADKYQELALKTWYSEDDPLYLDPRHPLIKLAGEAGELLDLYGKHEYKPGFSWWKCKHCKQEKQWHSELSYSYCHPFNIDSPTRYTPLVLDELGDWWYYLRITTWQQEISIDRWINQYKPHKKLSTIRCLSKVNFYSARVLDIYSEDIYVFKDGIYFAFGWFLDLLSLLDCSIDHLTELNYNKLNSEPTAHGWKK